MSRGEHDRVVLRSRERTRTAPFDASSRAGRGRRGQRAGRSGQTVDEQARTRLAREANSAARLDHPFICKIYEVSPNGERPFIAMEYVDGLTLAERLASGPLPLAEAMRIASELAEALDLAHERGILHRDLKPANVMLTRDGHEYQKGSALDPQLLTAEFVNGEYGFTLVQIGDVEKAADAFTKMTAQREKRARGLRSLALLDMYRGHYAAAVPRLREAILINRTNEATVSEFRDRLFLVHALDAKGQTSASAAELAEADRIAARISLGPEWLTMVAKIHARNGRLKDAKALLAKMSKTASDATAGSSANRDTSRDQGYFDERLGRPDAARQSYERLLAIWKDGDADLVALKEARARLARLHGRP